MPWNGPYAFGSSLRQVDAVTMIESNYGAPGNLEVIARAGNSEGVRPYLICLTIRPPQFLCPRGFSQRCHTFHISFADAGFFCVYNLGYGKT